MIDRHRLFPLLAMMTDKTDIKFRSSWTKR